MEPIKTRAIILTKTKYSEADLILKLISHDGEVFSAIAKSALKSKKRFGGGVLEPINYISVSLLRASMHSEKLSVLTEASLLDGFLNLRTDYDRIDTAFQFLKWVTVFAKEGDLHKELFDLLGHSLKSLETHTDLKLLRTVFELKVLQMQGVLPNDPEFFPLLRRSVRDHNEDMNLGDLSQVRLKIDWIKSNYLPQE